MKFWSYGLYIYCCKFAARPEKELNTESSKINEPHKLRFTLADNLNLKDSNKNTALTNVSIYCTWKNIKSEHSNNKFKVSVPTQNDEFDLPDESCLVSDIQDYFKFIIKTHETLTENPPIKIYVNKIKNRVVFKIKTGHKLELLTPETMSRKKKILIRIKMVKMFQNQNLLKLFQFNVIQSKIIISIHQKFYILFFQLNNLVS